ncbi:MAG: sensor histidine kinase [Crocinitomicaceae bacterium]|nr:sensor histidine kinase [Crocinitomicaceae bacterium]
MSEDKRIESILNTLMSLARLDFNSRIPMTDKNDSIEAIATGVNMLGEELRENVFSLKEKETLIKELHHRLKNNMQIIISLLKLQAEQEENEQFIKLVKASQSRIAAMALVHEMLYNTDNFVFTNFKTYVDFLASGLFMTHSTSSEKIKLELNIDEEIFFEIDAMIPLGLMLNEMISNSLLHAFDENGGVIRIDARVQEDGWYIIQVSDNGIGFPEEFQFKKSKQLGTQLIVMLSDQLDAKIDVKSSNGVHYQLKFM